MQEPAYPIFFPTYSPIPTGYARDWWWYDPEVESQDVGPFSSRSEAVSDWAWEHICTELIAEACSLDAALESPLLQPPAIVRPEISQVMPSLRRSLLDRQALTEQAFELVAELESILPKPLPQEVSA